MPAKAKIKLGYDNLEDARSKLINTFCLYKGKAMTVKVVNYKDGTTPEENKFVAIGSLMSGGKLGVGEIDITDPEFNCSEYNIGYLNAHGVAAWFYRAPYKQYQQGLKPNQVISKLSNPGYGTMELRHSKAVGDMLENTYPTVTQTAKALMNGETHIMAFHKNFAMSRDNVHGDFIVEYKGNTIGFTPDLKTFKLLEEHEHLYESLTEIMGK